MTRREILLTAPAVLLVQSQAQTQPETPRTPADELAAARATLRRNAAALDLHAPAMATEPAFHFKA